MRHGYDKRVFRTLGGVVAALVLLVGLSGCDMAQSGGGLAVIDLDAVAKAMGRDTTINEQVQAFGKEQEAKLQDLKKQLESKVSSASQQLGEDASAADKQSLANTISSARAQLTREVEKARHAAQELRAKLVRDFAVEVQPVARKAAEQRGLTVVMVKQPGMLVVLPQADITNAVIDALQTKGEPVAPSLPGKPASE